MNFQEFYIVHKGTNTTIVFSYFCSLLQVKETEEELNQQIKDILSLINESPTEAYNRELAIHDYLISNVNYEDCNTSNHMKYSAVGALLNGKAVCAGFAMAFKLLCDAAGLSCIILRGKAKNSASAENHLWNIVKLNGKCYHIDVTWDSSFAIEEALNRACFNLTDQDIARDHTWDRELLPKCFSLEDNYFVRSGLFFTNSKALKRHFISGLKKGERTFSVKINHKFEDEVHINRIFQEAVDSLFIRGSLGYSYRYNYDSNRKVVHVSFQLAFDNYKQQERKRWKTN
ncbi:hypothetical protein JZO70_09070 [Enterococcus sp. 669A]|uniref:Transglutaminase-like domain-containing protein n=1 Tax=Candidatus Enterococcus moelleringii TaxID=2815325 RepID=A0ABS3L9L6_9ENTE|nr:hypothetical protein [Enterococcus sp. 669A]